MRPVPLAVVCLLSGATCVTAVGAARAAPVARYQQLIALSTSKEAHARPSASSTLVLRVRAQRPITGERTVLPVLADAVDDRGKGWVRVRLPGRTLQHSRPPRTGWIPVGNTRLVRTGWHIVVHLAARRLVVYRVGRRVKTFAAIIGKPSTPTPTGGYFVEENVRLPHDDVGAPFALALSARSAVLQEFDGGPGQIAIHGVRNIGGPPGSAVSHGCIRLASPAITWLATRIDPGTPVTIT